MDRVVDGEQLASPRGGLAVGLLLACFLGSLLAGLLSDGVYHEDDLTHYLFARWSWHDARYLLDSWGRPGFTIPYASVAWVGDSAAGLRACRALSSLMAAATAWLAFCIARRLGVQHAWAAIPLLYLQPLFTRLSLTTLTETPLGLYFALATWLLLSGRYAFSAIIMSLCPVTRDEAVVLLPVWAAALWLRHARWWVYPLLAWAVVAHNVAGWCFLGAWPMLRWLEPAGLTHYGQGTPLTFVPKLILGCGPVIVSLAIVAGRYNWRRPGGGVIAAAALAYFLAETAIYVRGAYSSGGYARFLVPICPWLAVLAAGGIDRLLNRDSALVTLGRLIAWVVGLWLLCELEWHWRMPTLPPGWETANTLGRTAAAILCFPLGLFACRLMCQQAERPIVAGWLGGATLAGLTAIGLIGFTPLRLTPEQQNIREAAPALAAIASPETIIFSLNRWVYYFTDRSVACRTSTDVREQLNAAGPGTLFAWDQHFCTEPTPGLSYAEMRGHAGWLQVWPEPAESVHAAPFLACFERQPGARLSRRGEHDHRP